MGAGDWIAIYAAIVATGAFALEARRWFESGPKVVMRANPGMTIVGQGRKTETGLLVVNAVNRGDAPTTITHFCLLEYPSRWAAWRRKHRQSFVILHPQLEGYPPAIPKLIGQGEEWTGIARPEGEVATLIESGTMWAAVYTTDRDRPYTIHIPKRNPVAEKLKSAKKI